MIFAGMAMVSTVFTINLDRALLSMETMKPAKTSSEEPVNETEWAKLPKTPQRASLTESAGQHKHWNNDPIWLIFFRDYRDISTQPAKHVLLRV